MIRKLRIALANWIAPKDYLLTNLPLDWILSSLNFSDHPPMLPPWIRPWVKFDENVLNAVKTFPGGLTFLDKEKVK